MVKIFQGKEFFYNNILDLDVVFILVCEFVGFVCVVVKYNNFCGVVIDKIIFGVCEKVLQVDFISVFGGIVVFNWEVDIKLVEFFGVIFLECVVVLFFIQEVKEFFVKKKNLCLLEWFFINECKKLFEVKSMVGGFVK